MKGQEYIQRQINLVKQQIKGRRVKFIITDAVTKFQYDLYENELQTLESIEKSLKALEIIKKKNINIKLLKASSTVEQYNNELIRVLGRWFAERDFLTKEEFNLLKEVLE